MLTKIRIAQPDFYYHIYRQSASQSTLSDGGKLSNCCRFYCFFFVVLLGVWAEHIEQWKVEAASTFNIRKNFLTEFLIKAKLCENQFVTKTCLKPKQKLFVLLISISHLLPILLTQINFVSVLN